MTTDVEGDTNVWLSDYIFH